MKDLTHIFKAYDVRGKVGDELTPKLVESIGRAMADWLPNAGTVAVGRDMRPDSAELAGAMIKGLTAQGRNVIDLSAPGIISFEKKKLSGGREKITIIRNEVKQILIVQF